MENKEKIIDLEYQMFLSGYSKKQIANLLGSTTLEVRRDLKIRKKNKEGKINLLRKMPIISFN